MSVKNSTFLEERQTKCQYNVSTSLWAWTVYHMIHTAIPSNDQKTYLKINLLHILPCPGFKYANTLTACQFIKWRQIHVIPLLNVTHLSIRGFRKACRCSVFYHRQIQEATCLKGTSVTFERFAAGCEKQLRPEKYAKNIFSKSFRETRQVNQLITKGLSRKKENAIYNIWTLFYPLMTYKTFYAHRSYLCSFYA